MKQIAKFLLLAAPAALLHAHFVFAVPEESGAKAHVFLSETLTPDSQIDVAIVAPSKLQLRDAKGKETALTLTKGASTYTVPLSGSGLRLIHGITDMGVSTEGRPGTKPFLLIYHPKTILGNAFDAKSVLGDSVPVELIPAGKVGEVRLKLVAHGKPVPDSEITVIQPDGKEKKVKTDATGLTAALSQTGRYGAWARYWDETPGERDGKKYEAVHHYATIVFDAQAGSSPTAALKPTGTVMTHLPEASASLGAIVSGDYLYTYGGHVSPTHSYYKEAVSGRFDRVNLKGAPTWETLHPGPAVQGMNLTAYKGKIYRAGGMMPMNKKGAPADNRSIPDVARFDPYTKEWETLPSMPEGRSSHDVAVVGDKLIVVGGWTMLGTGKGENWMETTLVMDLAAPNNGKKLEWMQVKQPFTRRAFMAAAFDGKVYVIGGMDENEAIVPNVSIFDPKTNKWSEGPALPVGGQLAFAPAATVHKGALFVSIGDGSLLRLAKTGKEWERAGSATPRIAHRIASNGDSILIIGGAMNGKNSDLVEAVEVAR